MFSHKRTINSDSLWTLAELWLEDDEDVCGTFIPDPRSDIFTIGQTKTHQKCRHNHDCFNTEKFIFHSHSADCHPFPSFSDFKTFLQQDSIQSMQVITTWGIFSIERLFVKSTPVAIALTLKKDVDYAIRETLVDQIPVTWEELNFAETIQSKTKFDLMTNAIKSINDLLRKYGVFTSFLSWADVRSQETFPLASMGPITAKVELSQLSILKNALDKNYEACGIFIQFNDPTYIGGKRYVLDNMTYTKGTIIENNCDKGGVCHGLLMNRFIAHTHPLICHAFISLNDVSGVYNNQMIDTSIIVNTWGIFTINSFKPQTEEPL